MSRFKDLDWGYAVEDTVTGKRYTVEDFCNGELTKVLNSVNDSADKKIAKLEDDKKYYLRLLMNDRKEMTDEIRTLEEICRRSLGIIIDMQKILDKYEIESLEKLDQVLFNQRVW